MRQRWRHQLDQSVLDGHQQFVQLQRGDRQGGQGGNPGGGNGGAIYNDGNEMTLRVLGTRIETHHAREGGGGSFFVSNNRSGRLIIDDSVLRSNPSDEFETAGFPGIFYLGFGPPQVTNSVIQD